MIKDEHLMESSDLSKLDLSEKSLLNIPADICERSHRFYSLDLSRNRYINLNDDLRKFPNLRSLALADCYLSEVPEGVSDLVKLEELILQKNEEIRSLSPSLSRLSQLRKLDVSNCSLTTCPDWLGNFEKLEELNLARNTGITSLDPALSHLTLLKKLDVSQCSLTLIPDWLGELQTLEELNLQKNEQLKSLNSALSRLSRLKKLDISQCSLSSTPDWLGSLTTLQELMLQKNEQLRCLNPILASLTQLKKLDISQCSLSETPDWLGQMTTLTELHLERNKGILLKPTLARLSQLQILNLSWCSLTSIPHWLGNFPMLEELRLLGNGELQSLNPNLARLRRLKKLGLSFCSLTSIPDWLGDLQMLEELLLFQNDELRSLNPKLANLHNLKKLDIQRCSLTTFPNWLGELQQLEELALVGNTELKQINPVLSNLKQLKKLDISQCSLTSVPECLGDLHMLEELLFWGNKDLQSLHSTLSRLSRLKTKLCISCCSLNSIPDYIGELKLLQVLHLARNSEIQCLNPTLVSLKFLKMLDVSYCALKSIPDWIKELQMLEKLYIQGNKDLQSLNPAIARLSRLRKLDISECSLSSIPDELGTLPMLTVLTMRDNKLKEYPDFTLRLKNIRSIDLSNVLSVNQTDTAGTLMSDGNCIKFLPVALAHTTLRTLKLEGNPITEPPEAIWKQGVDAVKSFMSALIPGGKVMCADTINMLGNSLAGKTSVAQSLAKGCPHLAADEDRTRVMQQLVFNIDAKAALSVNINDFGGHYIYHSIIPIFLPCDGLPILVYDMSEQAQMQEIAIKEWLITILTKSRNIRVIIAGTRSEKFSTEERLALVRHMESFSAQVLKKAIEEVESHENLLKLASSYADVTENLEKISAILKKLRKVIIQVVALSCTAQDQGLTDLRDQVKNVLRPPASIPIHWCQVINAIFNANPDCLFLKWEDVLAISEGHLTDDKDNKSLKVILRYLVTTSQIFWLEEHPQLRRYIFHSPKRTIELCRRVLDHNQALQTEAEWAAFYSSGIEQYKKGILQEMLMMKLLSVEDGDREVFINFLQQFNLISLIGSDSNGRTFFIPSNLPVEAPLERLRKFELEAENNFSGVSITLFFTGSLIPMAFFETSMASMMNVAKKLDGAVYDAWRDGIIILHNDVKLAAMRSNGIITITAISHPNTPSMWSILHPVLKGLNDNVATLWHGIPPNCAILCPACKWRSRQDNLKSTVGKIDTTLQSLSAEVTTKNDKITCRQCEVALPRCLCYPAQYGPFTTEQQNEIDTLLKLLEHEKEATLSDLARTFKKLRPRFVNELDKRSVYHIVDELLGEEIVDEKTWRLIKAEATDIRTARLLHDVVSDLGDEAIRVTIKALKSPNVDRSDLAS